MITDHHKLLTSQLAIHLIGIFGLYYFWDVSWLWFTLLGIILFGGYGIEGYCHRYLSHKSFTVSDNVEKFLNLCGVFALQGSPMIWASNHVTHHQHSDKDGDPHPAKDGWKTWFWIGTEKKSRINLNVIKRLSRNKLHRTTNKYYFKIYWSTILISLLINPMITIYFFAIPVIYVFHTSSLTNVVAHLYGYKNFETGDNSTNLPLPFVLGSPYHNNHHHSPSSYDNAVKWYEFDHIKYMIDLVRKK